jgi:diacylglycerol kinase family enzyme
MSKIDDGLLDVLILEYRNLLATCWNMLRYLCGCKPRSVRYIQTKTLSVTTMLHENTDVDGQAGPDFPMVITCLKDGLRVRC